MYIFIMLYFWYQSTDFFCCFLTQRHRKLKKTGMNCLNRIMENLHLFCNRNSCKVGSLFIHSNIFFFAYMRLQHSKSTLFFLHVHAFLCRWKNNWKYNKTFLPCGGNMSRGLLMNMFAKLMMFSLIWWEKICKL